MRTYSITWPYELRCTNLQTHCKNSGAWHWSKVSQNRKWNWFTDLPLMVETYKLQLYHVSSQTLWFIVFFYFSISLHNHYSMPWQNRLPNYVQVFWRSIKVSQNRKKTDSWIHQYTTMMQRIEISSIPLWCNVWIWDHLLILSECLNILLGNSP